MKTFKKIHSYRTGLWATDMPDLWPSCKGSGWSITIGGAEFRGTPEERDKWALLEKTSRGFAPVFLDMPQEMEDGTNIYKYAPEVIINASNRLIAQKALNLIRASLSVLRGDILFDYESIAIPMNLDQTEDLSRDEAEAALRDQMQASSGVANGCRLAAKCSRKKKMTYAVYKLWQSLRTVSAPIIELDPGEEPRKFRIYTDPLNHVILSNGVTLAYSAIEEMQLEPRGSQSQPSTLPDGSWNPPRLADLESRLRKAKIDLTDPIIWTRRGNATLISDAPRSPKGKKASWSKGTIRDQRVPVVDALRSASWLRSKVTTHKFGREVRSLTFYDVHNVQFLARRLILESMGLWHPI